MMDIEKIRALVELMEEKSLSKLELGSGDDYVSLVRHYDVPAPVVTSAVVPSPAPSAVSSKPATSGKVEVAPMVGVFYSAPSPNEPPFVQVGQKVQAGDTLGIIEAMKIMNPLEATQSGVIDEILVNNADVVQFGQPVIRYRS